MECPRRVPPLRSAQGLVQATALVVAMSMVIGRASAAQYLINPGDDWQSKAARIRPGDEIILMPGRHREASFDTLVGAAGAPITIRGATPGKPTIIAAQLDGIRVKEGAHLVIKDLQIVGGSASGIWIGPAAASAQSTPDQGTPRPSPSDRGAEPDSTNRAVRARDVLIENVSISKVGPRGQRHGIYIRGFADVRMTDVRVEGWGGSAIELVACEDVMLARCNFHGLEDHSQYCGVRARGGCDRISISDTQFFDAGDIAVSLGGRSSPEEFLPPMASNAPNGSVPEVRRATLDQCVIVGSLCAIAYIHATDCVVRGTTIVRPRRCTFALLNESPDVRVAPTKDNIFGGNLIVWQAGDLKHLAEVGDGVDANAFVLERNLWWSNDPAEQRAKLGPLPGKEPAEQVFDVDPRLDKAFKPAEPAARGYGAR